MLSELVEVRLEEALLARHGRVHRDTAQTDSVACRALRYWLLTTAAAAAAVHSSETLELLHRLGRRFRRIRHGKVAGKPEGNGGQRDKAR